MHLPKIIIDPHYCSREEYKELEDYLDEKCWDWKPQPKIIGPKYTNKLFVAHFRTLRIQGFSYDIEHYILIVAKDEETAKKHLYDKLSYSGPVTWLMGSMHETIYDQKGVETKVQAKILYNSNHKV